MAQNYCSTCLFFKNLDNKYGGRCVRYPPVVNITKNANGDTDWSNDWPFVGNDEWCGEYKPQIVVHSR